MQQKPTYRWIGVLATVGVAVLFAAALSGKSRLAFRDVGHFYTPLYGYLGERTAQGQLPLWNPCDHTGTPLAGETTTAMFYPPRLVFALPLPVAMAMALYVACHLVLAAFAAGWAARQAGCGGGAAVFSGVAYAFACPVVFLYCNPPFLVGASWLPLALALGLRLLQSGDRGVIAAAALAFAMPVLGGDPQTPLHVGIVVALVAITRCAARGARRWRSPLPAAAPHSNRVIPLLTATALAVLIALPQVVASWDWAQHSARRYEPPPGLYDFSIAPWQWADLLIPSSNGQLFPKFQRLSALLPEDSRVWAVSLYGGVLTLLLAVSRLLGRLPWMARNRRPVALDAWDVIAPLGGLMAMGAFGPVWFLQMLAGWAGIESDPDGWLATTDPAAGGPYWMLKTYLPGYDSFRYPAKWLPLVSLGLAIAAGRQLQHIQITKHVPVRGFAIAAVLVAFCAAAFSLPAVRERLLVRLPAENLVDNYWGPLDRAAALTELAYWLRHISWVSATATLLLWFWRRRPAWQYAGAALSTLLLVDLLIANLPLIAMVDRAQEQAWLKDYDVFKPSALLRTGFEAPAIWQQTSGTGRVDEVAASERIGLQGRWHLPARCRVFNSATSITPQRYDAFVRASEHRTAPMTLAEQQRFWKQVSRQWNIDAYLHTSSAAVETRFLSGRAARLMDTRIVPLNTDPTAVRWHHEWRVIEPRQKVSEQQWLDHFRAPLNDSGHAVAVVEMTPRQIAAVDVLSSELRLGAKPEFSLRGAEVRDPDRVQLTVRSSAAGLLSRLTYQDGHWHCRYRAVNRSGSRAAWQAADVVAVDYLAQGVWLPAGDWEVEFWYRPWWLVPSLLISSAALIGLFSLLSLFSLSAVKRR